MNGWDKRRVDELERRIAALEKFIEELLNHCVQQGYMSTNKARLLSIMVKKVQ